MKLKISILGSTGSIGLSTLKIIDKKKKIFRAHIFSANKNFHNISSQIKRYKPNYFVITDDKIYLKIKKKFKLTKTKILSSFDEINIKNKSMKTNTEENKNPIYTYKITKGISTVKGGVSVLRNLKYPENIIKMSNHILDKI